MLKTVCSLIRSPIMEPFCLRLIPSQLSNWRCLHLTYPQFKIMPKESLRRVPKKEQGAEGEHVIDVDDVITKYGLFPDINTPNRLFNGVPYKNIPIVDIKISPNNTIMTLRDHKGYAKVYNTCGCEGFKNSRKGTNVAAQATAISFASKALEKGFKTIKVCVRGLGPGRMSSVKGLEMAGMEVISITDRTRITWNPLRPRKARRV